MENASARNMWGDYLDAHLEHAFEDAPTTMHLGTTKNDADVLAELVKKGIKKATSHSLLGLQHRNQRLPRIGDKSLAHWKKVHWEHYTNELQAFGREPRESMIVVCQEFEKVF